MCVVLLEINLKRCVFLRFGTTSDDNDENLRFSWARKNVLIAQGHVFAGQEVFTPGLRVPLRSVGPVGTVTLKGQEVLIPGLRVP